MEEVKYIIVDPGQDPSFITLKSDEVARLIKEGWKAKHIVTTKSAVHWVLIKYKTGQEPREPQESRFQSPRPRVGGRM